MIATCNVFEAGHVGWKLVFFRYILSFGLPQCIAAYLQFTVEDEKEFITSLMLQKKTMHLERTLLHQEKSNIKLKLMLQEHITPFFNWPVYMICL